MSLPLLRPILVILCCLLAAPSFLLHSRAQAQPGRQPAVILSTPSQNANSAELSPQLSAMFGAPLLPSTVSQTNFIVTGSRSGRHTATVSYNGDEYVASISVARPFIYGETIQAIVRSGGVKSQYGTPMTLGYAWKFMTGVLNGTGEFTPDARTYAATGGAPSAVAAADFNNDGYTDLVTAQPSAGSIAIFMNTTRQQFTLSDSYASGASTVALATADFNGDGSVDIAAANAESVSIFLNDGTGRFTLASSASAGPSITAIAAADLNNDGAVDLAVTNASENTVTFLKNAGTGSFTLLQSAAVGRAPSGIALEDLNNDGLIDALVSNRGSNNVWVLKNSGTAFAKDSVYQLHTAPAAIVSYDFDNDGYMDLAAPNSGSNDVSVMLNDKAGHFIGPGDFDLVGDAPVALSGGDFDGDGDIDLAVACSGSNSIAIMQNNGYSFPTVKSVSAGASPAGVAVLDMSGVYGILDIASANAGSGTLSILKNAFFIPPPAELTLSASSIDFPETAVGTTCSSPVQMSAGFSPLTIDSVTSVSGIVTALAPLPLTIGSYGMAEIPIGFSPREFGTVADVLTIHSNAGTQQIRISGTSPVPSADVAVQSLDFGPTKKNASSERTFLVRNRSLNAFTIDSISARSRSFTCAAPRRTIASNDSALITVRFTPDALRSYNDTLVLHTNTDRPAIAVTLAGTSPVPTVTLSAQSIAYGNVKVAQSATRKLVLKNPSLNDVTLDTAQTLSRFFTPTTLKGRISSGDSLVVAVTFSPDTLGGYADTLRLRTNTDRPQIPVALSGNSPVPTLTLSAQSIQFGNVRTGDTATAKIMLSNLSFNDVVIDTIAAHTRSFKPALAKCRIAQSDSLAFTVSFMPDQLTTYADTISLSTNSDRGRIALIVWGNSPRPELTLAASAIDFGTVGMKKSVTKQILLTNSSLNAVKIDSVKIRTRVFTTPARALPILLKTNDTTSITVTFTPDSTLRYADTLVLHSASLRTPAVIALAGQGEAVTNVKQIRSGVPDRFALNQNYPNPFNPVTTIQFAAPQSSYVTIKVYDVTGREIAEVFRNSVMAGYFSVQWNAQGIASGIYLYRMRAVSMETGAVYNETRKLVILK